ncbi:hypothetical protein LEP1GSC185_2276 [Leptospira licerasiae serovar Varillal str. VAR 010]|nr:hypothetical protein LEP1GSC185_2276 [Leptospira licerasiae serovar Varillal str. VAR 010]
MPKMAIFKIKSLRTRGEVETPNPLEKDAIAFLVFFFPFERQPKSGFCFL